MDASGTPHSLVTDKVLPSNIVHHMLTPEKGSSSNNAQEQEPMLHNDNHILTPKKGSSSNNAQEQEPMHNDNVEKIPAINVFEPECEDPISAVIIEEREIDLEITNMFSKEICDINFLCPVHVEGVHHAAEIPFRNYGIVDSDGIKDTYLQPFKVDETEDGELYSQLLSVSSENQSEDDDEEHKEQCDKLLKFDQEFELPSNTEPITESTTSRRVGVDHSYTERDFQVRKYSRIGPSGPFTKDKHRHHHRKHSHAHHARHKEISEEQFRDSKETDLSKLPFEEQSTTINEEPEAEKAASLENLEQWSKSLVPDADLDIQDSLRRSSQPTLSEAIPEPVSPTPTPLAEIKPERLDVPPTEQKDRKERKDRHKHRHRHRHRHRRDERLSLESKIMSGLEELEEESKAIREIATGINEDIKGEYDPNEVDDIRNHRMGNIQNIRHIASHVRPSRRAMQHMTSEVSSLASYRVAREMQVDIDKATEPEKPAIPEGFVELEELAKMDNNDYQWKQRARWIKFEEDVEKSERWGKPHVASLSFHSLLELRKGIEKGSILLNLDFYDLPTIFESVVESMVITDQITEAKRNRVLDVLLLRHCHHHQKVGLVRARRPSIANMASFLKGDLTSAGDAERGDAESGQNGDVEMSALIDLDGNDTRDSLVMDNVFDEQKNSEKDDGRTRTATIKFAPITTTEPKAPDATIVTESDVKARIPAGAEATSVMVATVDELDRQAVAFVRLSEGCLLGNLTEVAIPVRFLFIVIGPPSTQDYYEIGRSLATLMSDKIFHDLAYEANSRDDILSAINSFLDDSIVLSPGDWDQHLLLPLLKAEITARKKEKIKLLKEKAHEDVPTDLQPFLRTGKIFGGLVRDIKRRSKYYLSDFKEGLDVRCLVSLIFIFFATLAPTLSFGALLSKKTGGVFGEMETLLATSVCGMIWSLTAGQPLIIVGTTGPILVFEEIVHKLSMSFTAIGPENYLSWRLWIGLWVMLILCAIVAAERCHLVQYFTRFTEEVFSVLISFLFVYDAITFVFKTFKKYPIKTGKYTITQNVTIDHGSMYNSTNNNNFTCVHSDSHDSHESIVSCDVTCDPTNVGLISSLLVVGTFFISFYLRKLRFSNFLSSKARRVLSDFGVPIAMITMIAVNVIMDVPVPKIKMPHTFKPTLESREHFLIYDFWKISIGWVFLAFIPAFCVSILLFMETELTGVLINKNSNKLKKGGGYNIDLMSIALCTGITSVFGLPWMCPAPIRSVQHQKALMIMSRTHAPGEKPYLEQIKEQRVTNFGIHMLMGLTLLAFNIIELTPLAVCYGVFLYLGISSLSGIQFMEQLKLIFVPMKYHPNKKYVQNVTFGSLVSYTGIQLLCLGILIALKLTAAAPAFPFFLIAMVFIRKSLVRFYPAEELEDLDNSEDEEEDDGDDEYNTALPM